jgi:hypothetical protein
MANTPATRTDPRERSPDPLYAAIRGFVLDFVWWLSIAKLILWLVTKIEEGIIRESNARAEIVARWPILAIKKCKLQAAMHKLWTVSLRLSSLHF